MSFRINREEFLRSLSLVSPGLSAKPYVEQSQCFVFSGSWAVSYNEEICCRIKLGLPGEITGAVHAKTLTDVLEHMRDDELDLSAEGGKLVLSGDHDSVDIRLQAEILLPFEQIDRPASWSELPEEFETAVKQVAPVAGTDEDEFVLTCVNVHPEWLEATDRKQIVRFNLDTGVSRPFLVRAKSLSHVRERGLTHVAETDNWIHFRGKVEGKMLVASFRRHLDAFPSPQITRLLDFKGTPMTLPRGAKDAAKLGQAVLSEDKDNDKVVVRLSDGIMVVRGEGRFARSESKGLETSYRGEPVTFRIAPDTLEQLVESYVDCEIAPGKLIVRGERWAYLTVLGSAEDAAVPQEDEDSEPVEVGAGDEGGED